VRAGGAARGGRHVYVGGSRARARAAARGRRRRRRRLGGGHNDFLWAKILLLHAENLFIDFGAES
jgi:hypothetical protein